MKRCIFAALLAGAMVLSLAACGGKNGGGSSSSNPGNGSDVSVIGPGGSSSQPDASNPDGSQPDASNPDGSGSQGDTSDAHFSLNTADVVLKKAGATFQLRWTAEPDTGDVPTFTSSKPEVATVSKDGTITAVTPGRSTIAVQYGDFDIDVSVRCDWKEETKPEQKPDPKPDGSGSGSSSGDSSSSASKVDLQAFYDATTGKYDFGFLELADSSLLDQMYAGLTGISTEQMLVYITMMSMNNGEFGLVQVKDSKDVDTVKAIFQARISYMVGDGNGPGGAWYPGPTEMWENNSRVVSNGNYVMMVIHENCDDIVNEFNALF